MEAELQDEGDRVLESRLYRIQDLVNYARHRNAPQTAVWPPKALEGWNRYYLLRYDDGNALPLAVQALEMNAALRTWRFAAHAARPGLLAGGRGNGRAAVRI